MGYHFIIPFNFKTLQAKPGTILGRNSQQQNYCSKTCLNYKKVFVSNHKISVDNLLPVMEASYLNSHSHSQSHGTLLIVEDEVNIYMCKCQHHAYYMTKLTKSKPKTIPNSFSMFKNESLTLFIPFNFVIFFFFSLNICKGNNKEL